MSYYHTIHSDTYLWRHSRRKQAFVRKRRLLICCLGLLATLLVGNKFGRPDFFSPRGGDITTYPKERIGVRSVASSSAKPSEQDARLSASSRLPFEPRVLREQLGDLGPNQTTPNQDLYPETAWRNVTVVPGDNLSRTFNRVGANKQDMQKILDISKESRVALTNLSPGQTLRFRLEAGRVEELIFEQDFLMSARFDRNGTRFSADWIRSKPEVRLASAVARVNHSLFIDGQKAGLTDRTIMEFINVFGWDVDFLRDLQRGDQFSVVYEELYKDGQRMADGKILAAEFITGGKRLRAIYYDNHNGLAGYFSDKGDAMRKAFLRTPVNFSRISSRFSLARKHPILNRIRAHKGVDYSAPTGTPIQAVADGKIAFVGWKNGYGKVIQLKHGNIYSTLYGHMSNFARDLRTGSTVDQGQTIGFVGRTGLATGPHLHYEFLINGAHHDPLTVKLPNSLPLDRKFKHDFTEQSAPLLARLDSLNSPGSDIKDTMVAKNEALDRTELDSKNQ